MARLGRTFREAGDVIGTYGPDALQTVAKFGAFVLTSVALGVYSVESFQAHALLNPVTAWGELLTSQNPWRLGVGGLFIGVGEEIIVNSALIWPIREWSLRRKLARTR